MELAKEEVNNKGFKIIRLDVPQMLKLGGLCICDSCNKGMFKSIFIGALNRAYCEDCYTNFEKRSVYYPEDSRYESIAINRTLQQINS